MIIHPVVYLYVFTFNQKTLVSKETLLELGSIVIEVHGCLLKSTVSSFLKRGPVDASPKALYLGTPPIMVKERVSKNMSEN